MSSLRSATSGVQSGIGVPPEIHIAKNQQHRWQPAGLPSSEAPTREDDERGVNFLPCGLNITESVVPYKLLGKTDGVRVVYGLWRNEMTAVKVRSIPDVTDV